MSRFLKYMNFNVVASPWLAILKLFVILIILVLFNLHIYAEGEQEKELKAKYDNGIELFNSAKYKKAKEELEDFVAIVKSDAAFEKEYENAKVFIDKIQKILNEHLTKAKQAKRLSEQIKELEAALSIDDEATEIKKLIKEAKAKVQKEVSDLYFKGVDLYAADKLQDAIKVWKEALELKPDHARIKKDLAKAESKLQLLK